MYVSGELVFIPIFMKLPQIIHVILNIKTVADAWDQHSEDEP